MNIILKIIAAGVWPALPLTGYWLLHRYKNALGELPLPAATLFSLMTLSGIVVWSLPMLAAAAAGVFKPEIFGFVGWIIVFFSLKRLVNIRERFLSLRKRQFSAWDMVLIAGLITAAIIYIGFPTETILGGVDQGVYANHGIYISRHGRLDVPYPYSKSQEALFKEAIPGLPINFLFPGFYLTSQTITVQFSHLFPVWLAQTFSTLGHHGLFRLNALFALLSSGIFYGLCRSFSSKPYAVIATLFLLLNPSQIWMSRITLSEIFTQFSILSGFLMLVLAIKNSNRILARWAGFFFGFSALIRIDSLFLVPLLLISHLTQKTVDLPSEVKTSSIWYPLYQMALPLFSLAVCYYAFFSPPYFLYLKVSLIIIGFLALTALLLLIVITPDRSKYFRKLLTSKSFLTLICFILIALAIYAYWIRPTREPFSIINLSWHELHGTRDYREDSLINLAKYLSPFVVWGGIFGFLSMLCLIFQKRFNIELMPLLLAFGGFATLYLWKPSINPGHFWAIRRFVPIIIPGFILFATFGMWWILNSLTKKWQIAISAFFVIYIVVFSIRSDALIIFFAENRGMFARVHRMANKLPEDEIIIAHGPSKYEWATPLAIAFDKKIIPLDLTTITGISTFNKWIDKNIKEGRPVYLLYEGNLKFPSFNVKMMGFELSYFFTENTINPLPKKILKDKKSINFYEILGISKSADNMGSTLGSETIYGVGESGFHGVEWSGSNPVRWTNGAARLNVPINKEHPPKVLKIFLASTGPKGTTLQIVVNDHTMFDKQVPSGMWNGTFDLHGIIFEKTATIKLLSKTFVPKEVIDGSTDGRELGIQVKGLKLLEKNITFCDKALTDYGYRSHLRLIGDDKKFKINKSEIKNLNIIVKNTSNEPWPSFWDLGRYEGAVRLGILWFSEKDNRLISGSRIDLPKGMFPGDELNIDFVLRPEDNNGNTLPSGRYRVIIGLLQESVRWFYTRGDNIISLNVKIRDE